MVCSLKNYEMTQIQPSFIRRIYNVHLTLIHEYSTSSLSTQHSLVAVQMSSAVVRCQYSRVWEAKDADDIYTRNTTPIAGVENLFITLPQHTLIVRSDLRVIIDHSLVVESESNMIVPSSSENIVIETVKTEPNENTQDATGVKVENIMDMPEGIHVHILKLKRMLELMKIYLKI